MCYYLSQWSVPKQFHCSVSALQRLVPDLLRDGLQLFDLWIFAIWIQLISARHSVFTQLP